MCYDEWKKALKATAMRRAEMISRRVVTVVLV
jgi:hypothetical protein